MEIIVAKNSGLCYGVKRALQLAKSTRRRTPGRVFTLGELIHNPMAIASLEKRGIQTADFPSSIREGTVIIRSHGVTAEEMAAIRERQLEIIDATCPFVKKAKEYAAFLSREV